MPLVTYITILLAILNYIRLNDLKKKESTDLALIDAGALQTPYYGGLKQSYRFLTAGFVHMSFYHLFMNLYCMYYLGTSLEYILGHIPYALLLVGSIILGNVFQALIGNDYTISGGLSSGIYGLLATTSILPFHTTFFNAFLTFSLLMVYPNFLSDSTIFITTEKFIT